jgi:hypothetical protein
MQQRACQSQEPSFNTWLSSGISERYDDTLGTIPDDILSGNTCSAILSGPASSPDGQIEEIVTSPMNRYVSINLNTNLIPGAQTKR